jgi:hypothetical protein
MCPAGGDVPDRAQNEKFGQKLDYLTELRDIFAAQKPQRSILVGDLNIAPREDDVWDHKKLLKIVSHTPIEVAHLNDVMSAGDWVDVTRQGYSRWLTLQLVVLSRQRLGCSGQRPSLGPYLGHIRYFQLGAFQPGAA